MSFNGLNEQQVEKSRAVHGANELPERKPAPWWKFFLDTFKDRINMLLVLMLIVFAGLAVTGNGSISEPIGIAAVLAAIAVISTRTSLKVQKSARDLKERTSIRYCNVIRDGNVKRIRTTEVVVGDVALLQSGDAIVADGYIADGAISVDNSVLNGESKPCRKTVGAERAVGPVNGETYVDSSSLFAGTTVLDGEGKMVVTAVGVNTVNGQTILSVGEIEPPRTSLELQIDHLASQISKFGYIGATLITVALLSSAFLQAGGWVDGWWFLNHLLAAVISALSIVVAAVPKGLPLIISLITTQNASRMEQHNILAKNTAKIPEAGGLQLLCTDKTGTLTYGKLIPVEMIDGGGNIVSPDCCANLLSAYHRCVTVTSTAMYDANWEVVGGNATERAMVSMVLPETWKYITESCKVDFKIPFNSANKFSAAYVDGQTFFKGAPERLIEQATHFKAADGSCRPIDRDTLYNTIATYTNRAMRVIATGVFDGEVKEECIPDGLTLLTLVAIRDDVRVEIPAAVEKMHRAGVQVMMVTGDALETASAIAETTGILTNLDDLALTATEFDQMDDATATDALPYIKVIARATLKTKLRIIQLAQAQGISVGMTGDDTNDASALRAADVGFSMGSGTEVCKEAGDIIIPDDNFVSITNAVLFGRTFMRNVLKFLKLQLPINISLVFLSLIFPLLFGVEAISAVQILLISIIMDRLNSLSFGGEPPKESYMNEQPVKKGSPFLSPDAIAQIELYTSGIILLFSLLSFPAIREIFATEAQYATARFALLVCAATVNGFNIRTDHFNLFRGISDNHNFWRIAIGIFVGIILVVQFGGALLHCTPLSVSQWGAVFGLSLLMIPIDFVRKFLLQERN